MVTKDKPRKSQKRGPKTRRLVIKGRWEDALGRVMKEANKKVAKPKATKECPE